MARKKDTIESSAHPFRGFIDVMSEMNRAQSNWMLRRESDSGGASRGHAEAYVPPADIFAEGEDLYVRCEVPGVRHEDVSVNMASGVLTVFGRRQSELDEDRVIYYARERAYGNFRRSMIMPEGVTENDITAKVRNGLVEIRIANGASAKVRTINISDEGDV